LALTRNADRAAAAIRVRRATLQARLAANALLPVASGNLTAGVSRPLSGSVRQTTKTASSTLGLAWEIDLFGRLDDRRDVARFEALATAEDRDAVTLSLIGTTASLHWQIAFANERIALAGQSLAYALRTRDLIEAQHQAGAVSSLERREVEQTVATQQAAMSQLVQIRTQARDALLVLLDGSAPPNPEPQQLSSAALPDVGVGIPAELLRRRPDLRAAELRLRGTLAGADAVKASYYPTLSLTGGLGGSSTALLDLLANPVATLGAGLSLPFLNAREMRFNTAIARTQYEEGALSFRKSLYTALSEVENALSARTQLGVQYEAYSRARDAAVEAEGIYERRYRTGLVPLRTWLDAQERRRSADLALAGNHLDRLQNHVTLIQALGGGAPLGSANEVQ
jgi:NodT family efflux transporter outer membrane factor (OMF) lipoprotein